MARRLPVTGSGDELDRVALSVNVVLDRLAALMETTRQITIAAAHSLKTPMTRLLHRLAEAEGHSAAETKAPVRPPARCLAARAGKRHPDGCGGATGGHIGEIKP